MTKKILLSAAIMILVLSAMSQSRELRISPFRFGGVHSLTSPAGEIQGYYTVNSESNGKWAFRFFDADLQETSHTVIEGPRHGTFNTMVTDGENIFISFVLNAFRTSLTYVVLDANGREAARVVRENQPLLNRGQAWFPQLFLHPEEGVVVVESVRGNNPGYSVEHLDADLRTVWRNEFIPSRGVAHVYGLWPHHDQIIVYEGVERRGKTYNTRMHVLNTGNGYHKLTMDLTDDAYTYFPTAVNTGSEGEVLITGTYYKGDKIMRKNSQGLFFLKMGSEGETLGMQLFDYKGLRPVLKTEVYDWFFAVMPEVWIHAIEPNNNGGYTAIGELYRYSGLQRNRKDERFHRIRLFDFMTFHFDSHGNMEYVTSVPRPHMILKLDAETPSGALEEMALAGPLTRARALKKFGAFTYRFHYTKPDGQIVLGFMGYEDFTHYAYSAEVYGNASYRRLKLIESKPEIFTTMQMISHFSGQYSIGFMINEMNTRKYDESEVYWRGLLPGKNGQMLTYEYFPLNGKLTLNLIEEL